VYIYIQSCALRFATRARAFRRSGKIVAHETQAVSIALLLRYSAAAAAVSVASTMPLKPGDLAKLFYKNIHVSARAKQFKELKEGEYVVVRIKDIGLRGEGRQKKSYSTVTYPAVPPEGGMIEWEGITLTKNLLLEEAAAEIADAPGSDSPLEAVPAVEHDHAVSSGDSDRDADDAGEPEGFRGPREGWQWSPCTIDARAVDEAWTRRGCLLIREGYVKDSSFEYFMNFMISDFIRDQLLPHVNSAFKEGEQVHPNDIFAWLAVLFAKAQWGVPDEVFWQLPIGQKLTVVMDPKRFVAIWKAMDPTRASWGNAADPHRHVTPIIDAFNARMLETFRAGSDLCLDESMLSWLGKVYLMDGWVVHPRKPDPKGYEFKAVCDVDTSILLRLELCASEENAFSKQKEFFTYTQSLRNAQILRMCKPWFGTGRTVTADSGFGSPAAVALLRENGLFANMMIKKARYWPQWVPNDVLERLPEAFDSVISCSKFIENPSQQSFKVHLTAHRDMVPRLYCHTMSVSTPYPDKFLMYKRIGKRDRTVLQLREVQPPQVGMHYSRTRNAVDVSNGHRKRPSTELVEAIHCTNPQQKVLLFILACVECNSKVMWSQLSSVETKDWWTFRNLLVEKLMYVASEQVHLRKKPANPVPQLAKHHLIYVSQWTERDKELMWPNGLPTHLRGRCTGCNRIVRSVCNCSRTTWLCDRTCFPEHVAKKLFVEHDQ
jgi:hypothetical protein